MNKEKDKILRTLEHIAITFDKFGFSPTIPICTGHKDFNYLFRLEIDTIKELCEQQSQRIAELEEQLKNAIVLPKELQVGNKVYFIDIEEKYIHNGKIYSITKELNYEENGFIIWVYCRYNDGLTYTHPIEDYGVELFTTKEEAQAKLEELGENK